MNSNEEQPLNAYSPIEVTPSGMTMNSNEEQPLNAYPPIEVTLLGMTVDPQTISSSLVAVLMIALQLSRESYTGLSGLTTIDSNEEQPLNASYPTEVTLSGITIDSNEEQPMNALYPIEVTLSGITIDSNEEQPLNASYPISVTP